MSTKDFIVKDNIGFDSDDPKFVKSRADFFKNKNNPVAQVVVELLDRIDPGRSSAIERRVLEDLETSSHMEQISDRIMVRDGDNYVIAGATLTPLGFLTLLAGTFALVGAEAIKGDPEMKTPVANLLTKMILTTVPDIVGQDGLE